MKIGLSFDIDIEVSTEELKELLEMEKEYERQRRQSERDRRRNRRNERRNKEVVADAPYKEKQDTFILQQKKR